MRGRTEDGERLRDYCIFATRGARKAAGITRVRCDAGAAGAEAGVRTSMSASAATPAPGGSGCSLAPLPRGRDAARVLQRRAVELPTLLLPLRATPSEVGTPLTGCARPRTRDLMIVHTDEEQQEFVGIEFRQLLPPCYVPIFRCAGAVCACVRTRIVISASPRRQWHWYADTKASGASHWTDPYLDEGGGNVPVVTYCVPLRQVGGSEGCGLCARVIVSLHPQDGVFAGVVTMDVQLDGHAVVSIEVRGTPTLKEPA